LNNNHAFKDSSYLHQLEELQLKREFVIHGMISEPPQVSVLQEFSVIKHKQEGLTGEFEEVAVVIGRWGTDRRRNTEENLCTILTEFQRTFLQQINNNNPAKE
jgi:hypothetical protein